MDLFDMALPTLQELNLKPAIPSLKRQASDSQPHTTSHSKSHPPPVNPPPYLVSLAEGMTPLTNIPTLVLGVQSDILFTVEQQREVADALRMAGNDRVSYYELGGVWGHDTFL
jgi:homoserine acetyltransferase